MAIKLTSAQQAAIEAKGKVIVSASAGSGKTFVMIERLTGYIMSGGDLDDVLAVTFTRKAAAQMKDKLRKNIIDKINDDKTTEKECAHLKAQLAKIPAANISTIHSFCAYLLRTHFYKLDIDGAFDILSEDDGVEYKLKQRAMDTIFDRFYSTEDKDKDQDFLLVLKSYTRRRSDGELRTKIAGAYNAIRIYDRYEERLLHAGDYYTEENFDKYSKAYAKQRADACRKAHKEFDDFMQTFSVSNPAFMQKFLAIYDDTVGFLTLAENSTDICDQLPKFKVDRKPTVKGAENKAASDAFSEVRDSAKEAYEMYFGDFSDRQTELARFYQSGRLAAAFGKVVLEFDREYTEIKREESKLDYNDLEHLTLKLLQMDDVKKEVMSGFKCIFVDEYQDVNLVQEAIISAISGDNVFLVGDVKQAIYGFRGSKSRLFTQKFSAYADAGVTDSNTYALTLPDNFRSATAVIDGVNALFSDLMVPEICDIDYKKDGVMTGGIRYSEDKNSTSSVTLHIFGKKVKQKITDYPVYSVEKAAEAAAAPRSLEGLAVVELVKRELGSKFFDIEKGEEREAELKDICILTRKNDNDSVQGIIRELTRAGFPVSGNRGSDVRETTECKQIIDILSYVDNGEQDVPMASAMLSPIGGFTENDLAAIRLADGNQKNPFRVACENYLTAHIDDADEGSCGIAHKLKAFYDRIEEYRRYSALHSAASLIDKILSDGAMEALYMRGNGSELKNVRRLAADAASTYGGLTVSAFLDKINSDGYQIALSQSGGDDSIKIMTMHASKGLEFPIVILADVCKKFVGNSFDSPVPYDEELGFVPNYYDPVSHIKGKNILNIVYGEKSRAEEVKNEMNLLYVACTRAMYRLHILAAEEKEFSLEKAAKAQSHAGLINMSRLVKDVMEINADQPAEEQQPRPVVLPDKDMLDSLRAHYKKPYAHKESIDLPAKSSASEILHTQEENNAEELFPEEKEDDTAITAAVQGTTSADAGTAYHRYLELCDFKLKRSADIRAQLDSFVKSGLMEKAQADLLNVDNLEKILNMSVFDRVNGKTLYREQEFLCYLPANKVFLDKAADDNVMVQGAIDLLCVGEDECAIIDYKYSRKGEAKIVETYEKQLELYRNAVSKITKIPTDRISTTIVNIYRLQEIHLN